MEKETDNIRERLLSSLPQPEGLAAYREETAVLLAKHARAIRWARFEGILFGYLAIAFAMLWLQSRLHLDTALLIRFQLISAFMALCAAVASVHYYVYSSQIATLKEIKQVQLQLLEVQSRLEKTNAPHS